MGADWPVGEIDEQEGAIKEQQDEDDKSTQSNDQDLAGPQVELAAQNDSASGNGSRLQKTDMSNVKSPGPPDDA